MSSVLAFVAAMVLAAIGYTVGSAKIIRQGDQAIVERLGSYRRTLKPGLNFVLPLLDKIVCEYTAGEQYTDVEPTEAITKDGSPVNVDAVVYWRVVDLKVAYYDVEDVEGAIKTLVLTTLRSAIGQMELAKTFSSREEINRSMLLELDKVTETWGVKATRVEVKSITPTPKILEALELESAARSKRQAAELEAEGRKNATISEAEGKKRAAEVEAEGTLAYVQKVAQALQGHPNAREIMQFLIAKGYLDSNFKLSESPNSKVVFMDPKALTEQVAALLQRNETALTANIQDSPMNGVPRKEA
jgi:regulator of protease activity HflC (stomatin/prohibitin superfamily)